MTRVVGVVMTGDAGHWVVTVTDVDGNRDTFVVNGSWADAFRAATGDVPPGHTVTVMVNGHRHGDWTNRTAA